uniref:Uncharacterized protein n=1 Tax=Chromera velia CCMP2878 TaxID=1169474 RepID=A0A0G4H2J5_9ALVE|eukprot:Cvel_5598.t1-p1 / transcript=Cvel_5598.t1 / gene=Cvel_5598 / organism=Chromera_velia_CCMP2878 / gene_product=hypothetical protein / transcript_product=hypothetical protein / location=Cvel_scaffold263:81992-85120(+) / protein_length=741 / sequence_SO=supercontig / SO=protein_coding / is_pseudo=false
MPGWMDSDFVSEYFAAVNFDISRLFRQRYYHALFEKAQEGFDADAIKANAAAFDRDKKGNPVPRKHAQGGGVRFFGLFMDSADESTGSTVLATTVSDVMQSSKFFSKKHRFWRVPPGCYHCPLYCCGTLEEPRPVPGSVEKEELQQIACLAQGFRPLTLSLDRFSWTAGGELLALWHVEEGQVDKLRLDVAWTYAHLFSHFRRRYARRQTGLRRGTRTGALSERQSSVASDLSNVAGLCRQASSESPPLQAGGSQMQTPLPSLCSLLPPSEEFRQQQGGWGDSAETHLPGPPPSYPRGMPGPSGSLPELPVDPSGDVSLLPYAPFPPSYSDSQFGPPTSDPLLLPFGGPSGSPSRVLDMIDTSADEEGENGDETDERGEEVEDSTFVAAPALPPVDAFAPEDEEEEAGEGEGEKEEDHIHGSEASPCHSGVAERLDFGGGREREILPAERETEGGTSPERLSPAVLLDTTVPMQRSTSSPRSHSPPNQPNYLLKPPPSRSLGDLSLADSSSSPSPSRPRGAGGSRNFVPAPPPSVRVPRPLVVATRLLVLLDSPTESERHDLLEAAADATSKWGGTGGEGGSLSVMFQDLTYVVEERHMEGNGRRRKIALKGGGHGWRATFWRYRMLAWHSPSFRLNFLLGLATAVGGAFWLQRYAMEIDFLLSSAGRSVGDLLGRLAGALEVWARWGGARAMSAGRVAGRGAGICLEGLQFCVCVPLVLVRLVYRSLTLQYQKSLVRGGG